MPSPKPLSALVPGEMAQVHSFTALNDASFLERVMEMGLLEGVAVELVHWAPGGGTLAIRVRGSLIALRAEQARHILVVAP